MSDTTVVRLPVVADDPAPPWSLSPGVQLLWRGDGSFHLEHDDGGVVVVGLDRAVASSLVPSRRAGHRAPRPSPAPAPAGPDLDALHRLVELGYVRTAGQHPRAEPDLPPAAAEPHPVPAPPDRRAATARRRTRVDVVGTTRVSAYLGALLGAAGVGAIAFVSAGAVRRRHLLPGGLSAADEGRRFAAAAADVVARAAPRTDVAPPSNGEPDLVVLCLEAPAEPELRDLLHRRRRAHLAVHVDAARGEVGPLVIPGVSACLRCADLHRLDRDPAWSVLAVQLLGQADVAPPSPPDLAARVATLAAAVALRWLDDDPTAGGTLGGSYDLRPGTVDPRRRRRVPHPECGCRAAW